MLKRRMQFLFLATAFWLTATAPLWSEVLQFSYRKGEQYRIISTVQEDVYLNGMFSHNAEIINRIAVEVTDVRNNGGILEAGFRTSEHRDGQISTYALTQEYETKFFRDKQGRYDIENHYFMPVVRDVPIFPNRPLRPGDTWMERGHEVHDLRYGYNISGPFRFPIQVRYRYLGKEEYGGQEYHVISIQYNILHRTPEYYSRYPLYPKRVTGFADQILYWDNEAGRPYAYEEEFSIIFELSNDDVFEFAGTAQARVVEVIEMDKEKIAEKIRRTIKEEELEDTDVRVEDEGVIITLENVRFRPDSTELLPNEERKIQQVAAILALYPGRDILISGHTALAGTAEGRQRLSEERAQKIAQYFVERGVRQPEEIMTQGFGATRPIADNDTPEGMARNRRVEITILEN